MGFSIITVGVTLIKIGALSSLGFAGVTAIKFIGKFDPKLKQKKSGDNDESDTIENLRKAVRS